MRIPLTKEQMRKVYWEENIIVNDTKWQYHTLASEDEDGTGKYRDYIYKRSSDNKYFRITIFYTRYGYLDYGYESDAQDNMAYEVEHKEITNYEWVEV